MLDNFRTQVFDESWIGTRIPTYLTWIICFMHILAAGRAESSIPESLGAHLYYESGFDSDVQVNKVVVGETYP